ncbi:ribonuclease H-like domain-containing protein [Tanacetum coccineum]
MLHRGSELLLLSSGMPKGIHTAYTDADWAGCLVTLSRSSVEAEYRGVANVVADTAWIRNLLRELHTPLFTATFVYCDNVFALMIGFDGAVNYLFEFFNTTNFLQIDRSLTLSKPKSGSSGNRGREMPLTEPGYLEDYVANKRIAHILYQGECKGGFWGGVDFGWIGGMYCMVGGMSVMRCVGVVVVLGWNGGFIMRMNVVMGVLVKVRGWVGEMGGWEWGVCGVMYWGDRGVGMIRVRSNQGADIELIAPAVTKMWIDSQYLMEQECTSYTRMSPEFIVDTW